MLQTGHIIICLLNDISEWAQISGLYLLIKRLTYLLKYNNDMLGYPIT